MNAQLASDPALRNQQVHRFVILNRELNADDGALTRTGKLRRDVIAEPIPRAGGGDVCRPSEVRFDGGSGEEFANVKIRDAKVVTPAQTRSAA